MESTSESLDDLLISKNLIDIPKVTLGCTVHEAKLANTFVDNFNKNLMNSKTFDNLKFDSEGNCVINKETYDKIKHTVEILEGESGFLSNYIDAKIFIS